MKRDNSQERNRMRIFRKIEILQHSQLIDLFNLPSLFKFVPGLQHFLEGSVWPVNQNQKLYTDGAWGTLLFPESAASLAQISIRRTALYLLTLCIRFLCTCFSVTTLKFLIQMKPKEAG